MNLISKILKESMDINYQIFCDMDGVLCDFQKGYHKLTGIKIQGHIHIEDWSDVDNHGSFWADLEWQPGGKQLWAYIEKYKPNILSSPSQSKTAEVQKWQWLQRLNNKNKIFFAQKENKRNWAAPNHILIDDNFYQHQFY
jgi:hypothetical protein